MVKVSYQARQQFQGLSQMQRQRLKKILTKQAVASKSKAAMSDKIVENLDPQTRVLWERDEKGNALILAIVSTRGAEEASPY